ncbi:MAG: hypothetical protein BroJett024_38820 [Alphaproteobacteria bacterium]|nr:MAG: hypothetical protein BroJett024_38820 [Alphaproteobacteria bacterium]
MATFTVHLPPDGGAGSDRAQEARFISEAPSLLALVFPALWLLFNRLWYGLLLYLLIAAALAVLSRTLMSAAPAVLSLLPALYLFLEGRQLVRARLERAGWRLAGVVEAGDVDEAEARWFAMHPPAPRQPSSPPAAPATFAPQAEPSIGIFGS